MKLPVVQSRLPRPYRPDIDSHSRLFWDALDQNEFLLGRCKQCDELQFPPRPHCTFCLSSSMEWEASSGQGELYAATRICAAGGPFACMTPYSVGLVDLSEGVRILLRLLPSASSLPPGSSVELVVVKHTDGPLFAAVAANTTQI